LGGALVPQHLRLRAGHPLQQAALLPAPGAGEAELRPAVLVLQVDQADADHVLGPGRAVLEVDLYPRDVAPRLVELQLVVVAEPVVLRPARDGAYGRQVGSLRPLAPAPLAQRGGRRRARGSRGAA